MSPKLVRTYLRIYTYSRKPGNYNGTIIFEIDIMKNSHLCHCQNQNGTSFLVQSADALRVVLQCRQKQNKQPKHL